MDNIPVLLILLGVIISINTASAAHKDIKIGPLVSFGELSELVLDNYSLRSVEDIEPDWLNPGGFIVGNQHSLALISPSLRVHILAGSENETAFRNGPGPIAYFNIVQDTTQINNGTDIILADINNHCIRRVHRIGNTSVVSTFAGRCGRQGDISNPVDASTAELIHPLKVLFIEEENIFYYLLPNSVVKHNLTTDIITLMYRDQENLKSIYSFVIDSTLRYLYVNHAYGISKIDTVTWTRTLVAGTNSTSNNKKPEIRDGSLLYSRFGYYPTGLTWLIPDQVLLLCDYAQALRIVNLEDGKVSTICKGEVSNNSTFTLGGPETCKINSPLTANVIDGIIYIGDSSGTGANKAGHILKLPYSQPICGPPELTGSHTAYGPLQDRYIHMDIVKYTCVRGYGINGSYDVTQCVRAIHGNGTVYGKWDNVAPVCKQATLLTMVPEKGQLAGGTLVSLSGIFSSKVELTVEDINNFTTTANFTRQSLQLITFTMPPSLSNIKEVTINIKFGSGELANTSTRSYQYLPNPSVRSVSRTSSISSGGLNMLFQGDNFKSAYNHSLIFINAQAESISIVTCFQEDFIDLLKCMTPDLSQIFPIRAKRATGDQVEMLTLTATLLSDGKNAIGNSEFGFTVSDSQPEFENFNNKMPLQFDLRTECTIMLNGSHLNVSLVTSDYQVMLKFAEDGSLLPCNPVKIQLGSLVCEPPVEAIIIPRSASNFVAQIQVFVGTFNITVGRVAFYRSAEPSTGTTARPQEVVGIVVPVIIATVVLIVAVVIYFIYRKKHRPVSGVIIPLNSPTTLGGYTKPCSTNVTVLILNHSTKNECEKPELLKV